jgi:hypothetical protein
MAKLIMAAMVALATSSAGAAAFAANGHISNPGNCNVVERNQANSGGNGLSTSVTAGNGRVSAQSSGGGVTVHSGNDGASASTATTGSGGNTTTVTNSNGNCTIYVHPGDKKEH